MIDVLWPALRAAIFSLDAETAHHRTLQAVASAPLALASAMGGPPPPALARDVAGLHLAGPIGLAAGLDKDGVAIPFWAALGFGFVEVGTVTAHPQPGNPRPRLFRLVEERGIINRMGFNNAGSEALARRLRALRESGRWPSVPVGANLGKSKITPLEEAVDDYILSLTRLKGLADYFTINVSSPNTPGLRALQDRSHLVELLPRAVENAAGTPVFLKIAPDLSDEAIDEIVELAVETGLAGLIATNTTLRRDLLRHDPGEAGGLSGRPLHAFADDRIRRALGVARGRLPVIGVGGLERASQVAEWLEAGCAAVQLYSAFIYEGPGLPSRLHRELAAGGS